MPRLPRGYFWACSLQKESARGGFPTKPRTVLPHYNGMSTLPNRKVRLHPACVARSARGAGSAAGRRLGSAGGGVAAAGEAWAVWGRGWVRGGCPSDASGTLLAWYRRGPGGATPPPTPPPPARPLVARQPRENVSDKLVHARARGPCHITPAAWAEPRGGVAGHVAPRAVPPLMASAPPARRCACFPVVTPVLHKKKLEVAAVWYGPLVGESLGAGGAVDSPGRPWR